MPSSTEVVQALYGTWRFARLDRSAMRFFDLSHPGVWRSFWAAPICYPLYVALLLQRLDADTIAQSGFLHILIVETIGYVAGWAAFPLVVLGFCRWIGREEQGFDFIVVYNWSQVLQTALFLLVAVIVKPLLPTELAPDIDVIADAAILAYEWFIALVAIGAGGWIAAAVVVIDVMLGTILVLTAGSLY
jgi:hypothetical protein